MAKTEAKINALDAFGLSDDSDDESDSPDQKETKQVEISEDIEMAPAQIDFAKLKNDANKRDIKLDYKNSVDQFDAMNSSRTKNKCNDEHNYKQRFDYRSDYKVDQKNKYIHEKHYSNQHPHPYNSHKNNVNQYTFNEISSQPKVVHRQISRTSSQNLSQQSNKNQNGLNISRTQSQSRYNNRELYDEFRVMCYNHPGDTSQLPRVKVPKIITHEDMFQKKLAEGFPPLPEIDMEKVSEIAQQLDSKMFGAPEKPKFNQILNRKLNLEDIGRDQEDSPMEEETIDRSACYPNALNIRSRNMVSKIISSDIEESKDIKNPYDEETTTELKTFNVLKARKKSDSEADYKKCTIAYPVCK